MHAILSASMSPGTGMILVFCAFAAFVFIMMFGINFFSRKMSGWPAIAGRFKMTDDPGAGESYTRQSGIVGNIECKRGFNIHILQQGICLYPTFARRTPCLIPWSAVRRVSIKDASLLVVIDYEKSFEFFLPTEALPTLQPHLSGQLIQKESEKEKPLREKHPDDAT